MPRSGLVLVAALLGSLTPALAAPGVPAPPGHLTAADLAELRRRCEVEEKKAKAGEASDIEGCAERYLAYHAQNPTDPQLDELLYNAGVMFEMAHSMSAATQTFTLLRRYYPNSRLASKALARQAVLYASVAMYDRAAPLLEEYAKRYAGEKDAYDAMSDAIFYRKAIGDDDRAIEDTKYFIKTFGARKPREATNAHFSLTAIYEKRRDRESVVRHLREYIRTFGAKAGDDRLVIAHAKIGLSLWEQSCPVTMIDGACVRVERDKRGARCAAGTNVTFVTVKRDEQLVKDAFVSFGAAVKYFEKTGGTGDDAAGARYYYASVKLTVTDRDLEAYLSLAVPGSLTLEPDDPRLKAQKRFGPSIQDWVQDSQMRAAKLLERYEQVLAIKDAASSIAAAQRIARVIETFATALMTAKLPASLQTGPNKTERAKVYCEQLATVGEPLRARAIQGYGVCLSKATELGWFDDAARSCERALGRLAPEQYPPLREVTARASNDAPLTALEPPL